jgi:two-component system, LuxR family, response regulator FixJ
MKDISSPPQWENAADGAMLSAVKGRPVPDAIASAMVSVVEDDASLRDSLCVMLEATGFSVRAYASAEAFLADGAPRPACMIVDVELPGLDGIALLDRIGLDRPPAILISGAAREDLIDRARRYASFAFLRKPFDPARLVSTVTEAVNQAA